MKTVTSISVAKDHFESAAARHRLSSEQTEALWRELATSSAQSRFNLPNLSYYFGALVVMVGMTLLVPKAWEKFGGAGLFFIALVYAVGLALAGKVLWFEKGYHVPGGLLITLAVCMTPLAIYGTERQTGIWPQGDPGTYADFYPWIRGSWFAMETGTIVAGLIALRYVRFPFLTAPIAFALWFMSMDLTPLLVGRAGAFSPDERAIVSIVFGAAMLIASWAIDRQSEQDFSFWGYLFGNLSFGGGLGYLVHTQVSWLMLFGLSIVALLLAVLLQRRVFAVFGALGVFSFLCHLASTIFVGSVMFPFVLTAIGLLVVSLGVQYQLHTNAIENAVRSRFPAFMKKGGS